jgi:hypothetical protein
MNNSSNEKRVFTCGCIVEWHLDMIKLTDRTAPSEKESEES